MTKKQLELIEHIKVAINAAKEEGIFLELDPETSDLTAGVKKANVEEYVCVNIWQGESFENNTGEYTECTYDDIFETVTVCDCSQKDDDDDVEYYAKYTNE